MRVAAIYDVHGNLPALDAVLEELRQEQVDLIVSGGDVTLGPMPREVLGRLRELDIPIRFLRGNCDTAVLTSMSGGQPSSRFPGHVVEAIHWAARQLDADDKAFCETWPSTVHVSIPGLGDVLFCHATPRDENEIFTLRTPESPLLPIFEAVEESLVVCGHTHMPFDRTVGSTRVVNAGSVGLPFGEPGAHWLLLGPDVEHRRTDYDLAAAAEQIRGTQHPYASQFGDDVQQPRSEQATLDLFAKAELR